MRTARSRVLIEGATFGVVAGVLFGGAQVVLATLSATATSPFKHAASVVLGENALMSGGASVLWLGAFVHLVLSALFGVMYAGFIAIIGGRQLSRFTPPAALGALFGLTLWLMNFHLVARIFYPWFLEAEQLVQALLHAFFYGIPLGLMLTATERLARMARAHA